MTPREKITEILNWAQTCGMDWNFMQCLKQELEELVRIVQGKEQVDCKWMKDEICVNADIKERLRCGWSEEQALTTPVRKRRCADMSNSP